MYGCIYIYVYTYIYGYIFIFIRTLPRLHQNPHIPRMNSINRALPLHSLFLGLHLHIHIDMYIHVYMYTYINVCLT